MTTLHKLADDELVRLYEEGNDDAFDVLLSRYQDKLFSYILFLVRNEDTANDIFQDTFVRAITSIRTHSYEGKGTFYAWLMCISRNLVMDQNRRIMPNATVPYEFLRADGEVKVDLLEKSCLNDTTFEDDLFLQESLNLMRIMVDRLPAPQREIILLRYYQDLSFKEIAAMLGISINTALGRVHYAVRNLRRMACKNELSLVG